MPTAPEKPFGEVEASLEKTGRVEELIRLYESRSREVPKADEAAHLLCRAADLAKERLKNPVRAEELFRRALVYSSTSRESLEGLRLIYEQRNDAAALADTLEKLALVTRGPDAAALYLKAGELQETKLNRRDRAVLCYQLASRASPQERQSYTRARKILLAEARYASVFDSLERERAALGDRELADDYVEFAERLVNHPKEHALATKALVRALAVDGKHARAHAVQKQLSKLEYVWRETVKQLKARSLEERDRRVAARQSLQVAQLFTFYEPTAVDKVKEAIDRCFALWPAMPDALDLLESFAEKTGEVRAALTVFSRLANDTRDKQAKVDLLLRIGQLLLSKLNDPAEAVAVFEQATRLDPSRPDAAELASEALLAAGRPADAADVLEKHLATLKDKAAQVSLRLTLSTLCERALGDAAAAHAHVEAAGKLDPNNAQVAWRLVSMQAQQGALDALWPGLELAVSAPRPLAERVALCERVAALCEAAQDTKRAFRALSLALPLDPGRGPLLAALTATAAKAGQESELALALRRAVQVAPAVAQPALWKTLGVLLQRLERPSEAQEAWLEYQKRASDDPELPAALAAVRKAMAEEPQDPRSRLEAEARRLESSAADPSTAAEVYRKILALDPDSVPTLKKLGAAATTLGRWEEVATVAERLLALADSPLERQEWRARLAQLYSERLNRRDEAARLYLNLLDEGVETAPVVGGLERLAAQGVRQADVSRALAPIYAKAGDYQRQVASLLVQLSSVTDRDEQKSLLSLLAETTEKRLIDERAAFELRLRGLVLDPADSTFRAEAVRLARSLKAQQELFRVFSEVAGKVDGPLAVSLLAEAAALAEEAGAVDDAGASLKAALERAPHDPALLSQLSRLLAGAKRWADLDPVLRARLPLVEEDERVPLWLELEQVNVELHRPREAALALGEALRAGASEAEHLPRLAQRFEQGGQLKELTMVQARLIELYEAAGDKEQAAALAVARARVVETALGDKAEAIVRYGEVLAKNRSDPDALSALENLLKDPQHREDAARTLLPVYEASKDHRKQVAALGIIAEAAQDNLERIKAHTRAAEIHSVSLRQPDQAFAALASAMRLAQDDIGIRLHARSAAEDADALDTYAEVLEELVAQGGPPALALHRELADVYERKLNQQDAAVRHLHAVLQLDPKHVETLKALQRLHRTREEWGELVPVIERLATLESDPAARSTLEREAAILAEQRLGDLDRAALNWRQLAARDVLAREAASSLDRLYVQLDRPAELAFALELRRNQEGQSPLGRELAFRLAVLRQTRLDDARGALEVFRQVITDDASHEGTRQALEDWARSNQPESAAAAEILDPVLALTGDHQRRIAIREARLANAQSTAERARLGQEIRGILERDLSQPQAAFMNALKAFTEGVERAGVRTELERLAQVTGSFDALAELYESTAEGLPATDELTVTLLRRAAEVREQLGEPEDAIRVWKQLLELAPQDRQALDSLGRLYERSNNARSLAEVYGKQAELAQDPTERSALLVKAAQAQEESGDDAAAIESWKMSLAITRSADALVALDRLFGRTRRFGEQADVLDLLSGVTEAPGEKLAIVLRRAALLEREGQLPEALRAFARALEISRGEPAAIAGLERLVQLEGTKVEAARLLEPLYRETSDLKKLVEVLEVRLHVADVQRRVPMMLEIAKLREAVGQKSLGLTTLLRAFHEASGELEVREELERLAADLGAFEELTSAYEDAIDRNVGEPLTGELWKRLAVIYGDRLARFDLATRAWNEVLTRNPKDRGVLDTLARIYKHTRQFKELSIVMRRQLGLEPSPVGQVSLLFELATLAEDTLSDRALAAQAYQAILERKPDDATAIKLLTRILAESERWPDLAALLGKEIALAEGAGQEEEALELMVRLGRLKLARLSDPKGALTTFQEVLRRKPAHAGAVGALEEMARSDNPLKGEAAATLEPVFAKEGDHLKQVQMLEARVAAEPQPAERAAMLRKMAELYSQQMDNAAMAFVVSARALKDLPDEPKNLALCLLFYKAAEAGEELEALLGEVAPRAADDAARAELYRALGRLQGEHGESAAAVESWKRVMEIAPTDAEAMERVGALLAQQGRVGELIDVLKRQLTIEEDLGRRVALMLQMAVVQEDQLKEPAAAITTLRRLLELKPEDPQALARMERLTEGQQRWPELADVLGRRVKLATDEADRAALMLKLGTVREVRLLDKQGAIQIYGELLTKNPADAGALFRVEGMLQREPQNQPASEVLLEAYRKNGDPLKLAQVVETRVSASPDSQERRTLLTELARLREAQGEPELAYLAYYRAFREDPNDAALRGELVRAGAAANSWDELAHALESELPRIGEPADSAQTALVLGQIYEQRLGEKERAAAFYDRARQGPPEVAAKALPALDRLYGELKAAPEQADVLDALLAMTTEPADRVALAFRLGQLAVDTLDQPDRAAAAFERVLEVDPKHLPSLRSLEVLYEQAKANEKLFKVLEAQKALVQGPERERVLSKMALVSSESLADVDASVALYRELLEKNPRNEQAFDALSQLLDRANRAQELKELLGWKLQFTVDPRELIRLNDRMGRVLLDRLEQPEAAIAPFKAVLERDQRHKGALEALRDIFDKLDRKEDLILVLRRLIPLQEAASGTKQIRIRLAELISQTPRREEALDSARRALEVDPHTVEELDRLTQVFTSLKAWTDAVRTLETKCTLLRGQEDVQGAVGAMFQVADLWRGPANKLENAGPALEKVLEIEPSNREAYEQVRELYTSLNDWRAYAQVLERYLPNLVTDDEKVATFKEMGRVQEQKLGAKHVAFLQYCRALQLVPSDDVTREQVERLADETSSYDELAAVYEEIAEAVPRGPLAERLYLTLAKVQDGKLDDPEAAETSLRHILEFDPTNAAALERLSSMFARRGQSKNYILSLEQRVEAAGSLEQRKEILREVARVYDEQMNRPDEAENALVRALELEPDLETFSVLAGLQRRQGNLQAVASTLMRMRDVAPTPEERSRLQVEVAQVYERELQDDEAAVAGYHQALEFDPANVAALDAMERLFTKLDRPGELLSVYERQLEMTPDYRERVKILFRSAAIWEERFSNLANADYCIEAALQVDPQNVQAIKTLERLRKAQGRWDELIGVVDRHIALLTNAEEKAELCVEMGDIFHQQLKAVDRAAKAYHQALELDPRCRPAMHALGTLYERSGNWPFALDMLEREATVVGSTPEAVELWYRMGKINEDMLIDSASAKRGFLEALRIDPAYLPAIRSLKALYEGEGDFESYEKALIEEARQTDDPQAKAGAWVEVGRYYESKENREGATEAFEAALELVPDALDAARPLADIYLSTERFDRCEKMLLIVTGQLQQQYGASEDPELGKELCRRLYRLGYVSEKNGKRDQALASYERAWRLDATYLPVLEGYGNLLVQSKRFEEALKVFQSILAHHRNELTDLEVAEIYWTIGDLHAQLKQLDRAENHFEKALAIDSAHEPSLRSMVAVYTATQSWEKAGEYSQKLLQVLDGEARYEVGTALGAMARDKLSDPYMAIDAYLAAHRIKPDVLEVMDALYVLYRETKQGAKAAEMLEKMLAVPELQQDVQRAKRVWFALGELSRDELGDVEKAAGCFNAALDLDWRFIEAFSAVEAMLGKNKKWRALDENYKRMIGRMPKTEDTHVPRMTLWRALGDLYLNVLKAPDAAVEVYKVVAAGLPDNVELQEQFAHLAQTQPGYEQQAVDAWRRALPGTSSPGRVATALAELAAKRKDYDSAWLAASVASGLIGETSAGDKEILTKLTPYAKKREVAQRQLTDRLWAEHLFHPKVRGPLSELLAILYEQCRGVYKEDLAKYGINPKKHLLDVASAPEFQMHQFRYVAKLLGMEQVAVYSPFLAVKREQLQKRTAEPAPDPSVNVEVCHADPVALRLGGKFFAETGQKELQYTVARSMAMLRPELALTQRLSAERLEAVVQAAVSLSVDRFRFTADPRAIDAERKLLERTLTQQALDALKRVTVAYVKVATPQDLRNYLEGAELSATRAGAFVSGDIEPVKRMVMAESGGAFRVASRSKIRDLMVFALGEDLHALRVAVGTNVEVQARK